MIPIRTEQLQALQMPGAERFIERLMAHLQQFFPARCASLDGEALHHTCRQLMAKGHAYGLSSERDLCKLANLAFTLGFEFDTDRSYPWAAAILNDPDSGPTLRINRLYLAAIRHLDAGAQAEGGP